MLLRHCPAQKYHVISAKQSWIDLNQGEISAPAIFSHHSIAVQALYSIIAPTATNSRSSAAQRIGGAKSLKDERFNLYDPASPRHTGSDSTPSSPSPPACAARIILDTDPI